jgi:UDP-N-acetylmuramoyl-L-alanyl-D-glutamate--2,6-diaminopimelate ligase
MKLLEILNGITVLKCTAPENMEITGISYDSRQVCPGDLFVAVSGYAADGHKFIPMAQEKGAAVVLCERPPEGDIPYIQVENTKAILFTRCDKGVLNGDDPATPLILKNATCIPMTAGQGEGNDLVAKDPVLHSDGVEFTACYGDESAHVHLGIPGNFTVYNALSVLGAALSLGVPLTDAAQALETAKGVKGRVEVVPTPGKDYTVLIDYAHAPDGLENVLTSVRGFCKGRLISVFGCGGDRDNTKRPIMGEIGARLSDLAIITSDNPRTEDPNSIINMILDGIQDKSNCLVEENRRKAIRMAMDLAQKDDIIVLCGKGHETYQILGTEKTHLDEREEVAAHLLEGM